MDDDNRWSETNEKKLLMTNKNVKKIVCCMHILIDLQRQLPLNISFSYVSYIFNVFQNSVKHACARLGFAFCIYLFTFDGEYFKRKKFTLIVLLEIIP